MLESAYGSFPDPCPARLRSHLLLSASQSRCHARPVQARWSFFFKKTLFYNRKSTFLAQIACLLPPGHLGAGLPPDYTQIAFRLHPKRTPHFWLTTPQNVFGHNLQHMVPFEALSNGFWMVFRPATLICLTPDPMFGVPTPHLGPGRAWGPLAAQKRGLNNITLRRDRSPRDFP